MNATSTQMANATPDQTLLRLPQVLAKIPVSRSHWWAGIVAGKYPAGIKLSERVTCWKSSDIQNLIASLK